MDHTLALYLAAVLGAVALALIMPGSRYRLSYLGLLLGVGALGVAWIGTGRAWWGEIGGGVGLAMPAYYYVFSTVALVSAVRVITHKVPVYSALWFVMVVVASAGLLVSLSAEFMAFAMLIIYGGAILVTYMFVIMLASQSSGEQPGELAADAKREIPDASHSSASALQSQYDRVAREPLWAIVAGFALLAVLLGVGFEDVPSSTTPEMAAQSREDLATLLPDRVLMNEPEVIAAQAESSDSQGAAAARPSSLGVTNGEAVGVDLFKGHPLAIELAGVILLVSLIGAVVIAKTRVTEEEQGGVREAGEGGATVDSPREAGPTDSETLGSLSTGRVGM